MSSQMDLSQAVAAGAAAGFAASRKRGRDTDGGGGKRSRRVGRTNSISRSISWKRGPIAPELHTKLRYAEVYDISSAAGGQHKLWNFMSIFDPDVSGVGHQPMGFDQLKLLYQAYRVNYVSWRIVYASTDATASVAPSAIVVVSDTSSGSYGTVPEMQEQANSVYAVTTVSKGPVTIKGTTRPHVVLGRTKKEYDADPFNKAVISTDPTNACYFHILGRNGQTTFSAQFNIQLTYDVTFLDPVELAQS